MTSSPALAASNPTHLDKVRQSRPVLWRNRSYRPEADTDAARDLAQAVSNWQMISPLLEKLFSDLEATAGVIKSELLEVEDLRPALGYTDPHFGRLFVKGDHALPVAGSVKARGGIFEVVMVAIKQARASGFLAPDDPVTRLASNEAHAFFSRRTIAVGSTGNLGLSVGIAAKSLGYNAVVHMSSDAKKWKIERLRRFGVKVIQHEGDYNLAVAAARDASSRDPLAHFVDDEDSELLFRGYSAAAQELADQLKEAGISIGANHPLFLYLPCGIGGAPGGIAYGARAIFGPHVHCFFAEPVQAPSAMVQMMHGIEKPVSVYDVGLTGKTEADGMAVATMSALVAEKMQHRMAGAYTVGDDDLFRWVAMAHEVLNLHLEPSAAIGLGGPHFLLQTKEGRHFCEAHIPASTLKKAIHIAWTTGGAFVPETQFQRFLDKGLSLGKATDLMKD